MRYDDDRVETRRRQQTYSEVALRKGGERSTGRAVPREQTGRLASMPRDTARHSARRDSSSIRSASTPKRPVVSEDDYLDEEDRYDIVEIPSVARHQDRLDARRVTYADEEDVYEEGRQYPERISQSPSRNSNTASHAAVRSYSASTRTGSKETKIVPQEKYRDSYEEDVRPPMALFVSAFVMMAVALLMNYGSQIGYFVR